MEPCQRWWCLSESESVGFAVTDPNSDTYSDTDAYGNAVSFTDAVTDAYSDADTVAEPIGFTDDAVQFEHLH